MAPKTKDEVKKPIQLRPLEPTADSRPGFGHIDEIAEKLAVIRTTIADMPDDRYHDDLEPSCVATHNSLERIRRFHWQASDSLDKMMRAQSGFTRARQEQAQSAVPTTGLGHPAELERRVAAAAAGIELEVRAAAIEQLYDDPTKKEAMALATSAADALRELDVAVQSAKEDWTGPPRLRGQDNSLESIWAVSSLQTELKVLEPQRLFQMFSGFCQRGEDEKAQSFMRAARSILVDLKTKPNPVLANMFRVGGNGGRDDQATEHRSYVFKLLNAFDAYQEERTPKSIAIAESVFVACREVYFIVCGVHASFLDAQTFRREYLDTNAGLGADQLRADRNWPQRYLPGGRVALPGWSAPIVRSSLGAKVRAPKGG